LTRIRGLPLPLTYNLTLLISLHTIFELTVILGYYIMKNAPKSVARVGRGTSSITDNIKAFNKSRGAQAAITVLKIIKNLACARCKKSGHREGVGNAFNSSAMVLGAPRFGLPDQFEVCR
jgi:hypothetical protein